MSAHELLGPYHHIPFAGRCAAFSNKHTLTCGEFMGSIDRERRSFKLRLKWTQRANRGYILSMTQPVRVFVADDSLTLRRAVRTLLEAIPAITVVGEASDYGELLARVDETPVDVVLIDVHMPGLRDAASLIVQLGERCILAMSFWNNPEMELLAKSFGALKLLDKTNLAAVLVPAIEECMHENHTNRPG
jgi:CheY-like chemotaxis protein